MSDTTKPTGETILIETMTDLVNAATAENHERLLEDMRGWLVSCIHTKIAHGPFQHATFINNPKQP